jgi:hypothetical protein
MARINIEDSIYKDIRFYQLLAKLGDLDTAIGALVRAWSLAQKWWLTDSKTIPSEDWEKQQIRNEIIDVGLAEKIDSRIRMKGSEEQFSWLTQKSEAGKKGNEKRWSRSDTDDRVRSRAIASSSFSSSFSFSNSISKEEEETKTATAFVKSIKKEMLDVWLKTYKDKTWVDMEISKAEVYALANPQKDRNIGQFVNSWLHRSYQHQKTVKEKEPKRTSAPAGIPEELLKEKTLPTEEQKARVRELMKGFKGNNLNEV